MAASEEWPAGLPAGGFRIARRSNHLAEAVAFYRDLVGLPLLMAFQGADTPDGLDGAIFGLPGMAATLELLDGGGDAPVDPHEELVIYLPGEGARDVAAQRLTEAGLAPVTPYQYWIANDSLAFADPDGRQVIFAPWIFGQESSPARRKAAG
jgi:hypothetical protein